MKFIDSKTHGVIDYITGILFIASPWIFDFADTDTAMLIPIIIGSMVIVMSLITDYEVGLTPIIPFNIHLTIDIVTGLFLMTSPWIFGFAEIVMWPHVIFGIMAVGVSMVTRKTVGAPHLQGMYN